MKTVVIMPGGFHPFHAGHLALYNQAVEAFPGADVYVAATDDTSKRPFPFAVKEKLARLAGVPGGRFVKVKSPFSAEEITSKYDLDDTVVIFVRSEKDRGSNPKPGGVKKDGTPAKLQPLGDNPEPASRHTYMAYLPTVEFGPGLTSATQIRDAWPTLNEKRKQALVMSLYPKTQTNPALAKTVVGMLDAAIAGPTVAEQLAECSSGSWTVMEDHGRIQFVKSSIFDNTIEKKLRQAPGLNSKLEDFVKSKTVDPLQPFNAKDKPFPGDGPIGRAMPKLRYVHLTHDIIMFYSIEGRDPITIKLYGVFSHDDIGIGMPRNINKQKSLLSRLKTAEDIENPDYIEEKWSQRYKDSINCASPKGFSQRAHCAGRKKKVNESSGYSLAGSFTPDLIESKVWLLKELGKIAPKLDTVYVLGSWYGNLALYMHLQPTFDYDQVINVETDPEMLAQSKRMLDHVGADRVQYMAKDANDLDYRQLGPAGAVVNTSLTDMPGREWFEHIPAGTLVVLQARDQDPGEPFNSPNDIIDKFPLDQVYYIGTRSLQDPETEYQRFMVIGRK